MSDALITGRFRLPDLVDIAKPVWTFDRQGHIQEGDPLQNAQPKWTYRSGLNALAKRMAQELQYPAGYEKGERPTPIEEKQRQRDNDQRNADAVRQLVQRMLVLCFVVFDEGLGHRFYSTLSATARVR